MVLISNLESRDDNEPMQKVYKKTPNNIQNIAINLVYSLLICDFI